jgi:septum formation protein
MRRFILASASPRRRDLLAAAGLEFDVLATAVAEEPHEGEPPREFALRMARAKALAASRVNPAHLVLAADTIVELEGETIGKPKDPEAARRTLKRLSGRTHTVITAFAIAQREDVLEAEAVLSQVSFRTLTIQEVDAYILSREPFDKAGAYGIQGMGRGFVEHIEGSFTNVMGLPIEKALPALKRYLSPAS